MATITGYTAEKMQEIVDGTIKSAEVVGGHLIVTRFDNTTQDLGDIRGPQGETGPEGSVSLAQLNAMRDLLRQEADKVGRGVLKQVQVDDDVNFAGYQEDVWKDITGMSTTFTPVPGRWYEMHAAAAFRSGENNTNFELAITRTGGARITTSSVWAPVANRTVFGSTIRTFEVPSTWTGPQTFKLQVRFATGFTTVCRGSESITTLTIKDVGKP